MVARRRSLAPLPFTDAGRRGRTSIEGAIRTDIAKAACRTRTTVAYAHLGGWESVADGLGSVITEIGERWNKKIFSVFDEHVAAEQLCRALSRVCEWLSRRPEEPRALLATPEGEVHTLGLSLADARAIQRACERAGAKLIMGGRGA